MEHIVEFAIGIDDQAVIDRVMENAEKSIIGDIKKDVVNKLFSRSYCRNADSKRDPLSDFSEEIVLSVMKEHEDVILQKAAEIVANKIQRSKKYCEARDRIAFEMNGGGEA